MLHSSDGSLSWKRLVKVAHDFASTLKFHGWGDKVRVLDLPYRGSKPHRVRDEISIVLTILGAARHERALLLNSSSGDFYPDVLACVFLGLVPRRLRPRVAIMGDMWEPNPGLRGVIEKAVIWLADRSIDRYLVMSSEEMSIFPKLWGVDKAKLRHCPYYYSVTDAEISELPASQGGHIFSGGDSARDYRPVIEAARSFPERRFVIATRWKCPLPLPPNVELGPTSHQDFIHLMSSADAVIVPIQQGLRRSVGQQTYLNSMYLRRPTIVADGFGVRDHIESGKDALIVDGTTAGYVQALSWFFAPENAEEVFAMTEMGHLKARSFGPDQMAERLFAETFALLQQDEAGGSPQAKGLSPR